MACVQFSCPKPFAFQTSERGIRHTLNQLDVSFRAPHRRVPLKDWGRLARPLDEAYLRPSANTRDKDFKNHYDLDHRRHSLLVVGLGFKITIAVAMMTG